MIKDGTPQHRSAASVRRRPSHGTARLAVAPSTITLLPFDLRCVRPALPIAIDQPASSPSRSRQKAAVSEPRPNTAGAEIPIASDARSLHTSRGFLPWSFAYAGPGVRRATVMGPASANLHTG
jgi:hypothetical protein